MPVCAISRFSSGMQEPQLVPAFSLAPSCIPELKRLIAQTGTGDPEQRKLVAAN